MPGWPRCSPRPTSTRIAGRVLDRSMGRDAATRAAPAAGRRRRPLRRRPDRPRRGRAATWPRTPPSWSRSTTSRCRRSSTPRPAPTTPRARAPRARHPTSPARSRPGPRARGRLRRRAARRHRDVRPAPPRDVPMETRGLVAELGARRRGSSTSGLATQNPHEVRSDLRPGARHARAPGPGDHGRRRRRLRPEDLPAPARSSRSSLRRATGWAGR